MRITKGSSGSKGVLVDEDVAGDGAGVGLRQDRLAAERIEQQRRQVAVVARIGIDVPERSQHLLHVIAGVEPQPLAVHGEARGVLELLGLDRGDVEEQAAGTAAGQKLAQGLVQRDADTAGGTARVGGEVLQVCVVELGEVIDEGKAG